MGSSGTVLTGEMKRKVLVQEVRVKARDDLNSNSNNEGSIGTA